MIIRKIEILGYRGFKNNGIVNFGVPNGIPGSGLTVIIGPNNSGKSSILESIKARENSSPSFSVGKRNQIIDEIEIKYHIDDRVECLKSVNKSSSETLKTGYNSNDKIFVLPSRRGFQHTFGKGSSSTSAYIQNSASDISRNSGGLSSFYLRLFEILKNTGPKNKFDDLMEKVLGYRPNRTLDQDDNGHYFIKFILKGNYYHSSEGVGEGIISIFSIIDALYDSNSGDVIVIDEPELSLHPQLQKRLEKVFFEYADSRQIIISTHSPYFIDFQSLSNGGKIVRVINNGDGIEINELSEGTGKKIEGLLNDNNNPHVLGLEAKEIFFQEDNIILVEGQEDIIYFPKILEQLDRNIKGHFFGWGMGGADKVEIICSVFKDLGYKKVFVVFDNDKKDIIEEKGLRTKFPSYNFSSIPADDIRYKPVIEEKAEKNGLIKDGLLLEEFKDDTINLINEINNYF